MAKLYRLQKTQMLLLGESGVSNGDKIGLDSANFAGTYTVNLTGTAGIRTTTITGTAAFGGDGTFTQGAVMQSTVPEMMTPVETLALANETAGWYVACAAGIDESDLQECAEFIETKTKQLAYTFLSETDPVSSIFFRSHGWCGLIRDDDNPQEVPSGNRYVHIAATARGLSFPAGSETWAFKSVAAIEPAEISTSLQVALQTGHSNWIDRRAGRIITHNGQTRNGEWIDLVRSRDWLQNDMQLRIFNLKLMKSKLSYTNREIALVENQMIASLKEAQDRGIVAPDEYDNDGNKIYGFTVSVPNSASLTPTQKASRVLQNCTFVARLAGAIHVVRVDGKMRY